VTVAAYVVGSAAGGCAAGAILGAAGSLLRVPLGLGYAIASAALLLAGVVDGPLSRRLLPIGRRQVDDAWLGTYRGWVYGAGYGVQLGSGVVTAVTSALLPALGVIALVAGSPRAGALLGLVFGLVRAAPLLVTRHVTEPADIRRLGRTVDAWFARARRAGVLTAVLGGCVSAVLAAVT
jgi:hypothetical protein